MTQYLILIYGQEAHYELESEDYDQAITAGHLAFGKKHSHAIRGGEALRPPATATSVRTEGGIVTDGPWLETKEALGGFYVVEADDLDTVIAMARDIPTVGGGVEIRPIQVLG